MKDTISTPLPRNEFIGHDGKRYLDLAVDSGSRSTVTWLRRRLNDKKYFLVVAVLGGHFLKKEVSPVDARDLYHVLPSRLPAEEAFPKQKKLATKSTPVAGQEP
jgi:hypothetical protein